MYLCQYAVAMALFSFLRFAKRYGVVDKQSVEMAAIGEKPRRRNELSGLLQQNVASAVPVSSSSSSSSSARNRRNGKSPRKSYFYS